MATYDATPVIGYREGRVIPKSPYSDGPTTCLRTGNLYFVLNGEAYDVHPYRDDLGGYPVRWHEPLTSYRASGYAVEG